MSLNKITIEKLQILDGIEIKSATFADKIFPLHFHQEWSLATITFGNEHISFADSSIILSNKAVILIPPYSIHKHWGNKSNVWGYKAIYLNNDIIKAITKNLDIDYSYLASFPYFLTYTDGFFEINEVTIFSLIENIFLENVCEPTSSRRERNNQMHFDSIASYLSQNYNKSITLDSLESKFKINKFNLQKNFKKKVGLSPAEYLTVTRIENSKQLFHTESTLTDIALKSGFYDQSHYTNSFLKFVGVTPGVYKRSVKILQE